MSNPSEAELSDSNSLPIRDFSESFNGLDVFLYVLYSNDGSAGGKVNPLKRNLFGETVEHKTDVALVEICAGFDCPGEEASAERRIGDDHSSELLGRSDN